MAEDEIQAQPCKFPRVLGNGRNDPKSNNNDQYPDNEIDGQLSRRGTGGGDGGTNRFNSWHHHSSRIIRVSRASGGKDRHSKVMTSKGLRDRRVRLSVTTAIQFYDLQDRLGYDQPSKAVEWLIKAAQDAIAELPSLNNTFPESPKHLSDDKRASLGPEQGLDSADMDGDGSYQQNQSQNLSLSKSACSSTSETSKGSGLSLSRSEMRGNRVKARERARERTAKEKEKESESRIAHHQQNVNPISQTASFTELLTGGIGTVNPNTTNNSPTGSVHQNQNHPNDDANLFSKGARQQQWTSPTMDYFSPVILGSSSSRNHHYQNSGFPGQIQLGNALNPQTMMSISPFNVTSESHSDQLQHFSFIPDHLIPVVTSQPGGGSSGDYSLNFSISSSGLAGFNRGTLQSNSPSLLPHHLQRFSPIDGSSNVPFFIGAAPAAPTMENHTNHHHQFSPAGFDGRGLQLCYGDGSRHSDQKGKGKN